MCPCCLEFQIARVYAAKTNLKFGQLTVQLLGAQALVLPRPIMSRAANATFGWYGNWNGMEWN